MGTGAITGYIDVAQVALYAFFTFFAILIFYLRREDRRMVGVHDGDVERGQPSGPRDDEPGREGVSYRGSESI